MPVDIFEEFPDDGDIPSTELDQKLADANYKKHVHHHQRNIRRRRKLDAHNEVGVAPPISPRIQELRKRYRNDFVALHMEVFKYSTGIKPFGEKQKKSIEFGQDIFNKGSGRLLKLEPRGYAKTTRITNEALFAVLSGMQEYIVIVCSNVEKASDILESIKTEIYNNEALLSLFPGPIAAFRHLGDTPQKARYQTYGGDKTYIEWGSDTIQFPLIPGEPCSGRLIEVRPMSNLKGLHKKIKEVVGDIGEDEIVSEDALSQEVLDELWPSEKTIEVGENRTRTLRPTLFLFDDPQTHDDAKSETNVNKIIARIKRDALRGGSHARRAAAIMAITPVAPGDVAWHFAKNEHSWDMIEYRMLEERPIHEDWWLEDYARVYLNYDRTVRGDRTRAALEAKQMVEDNWDYAHEGSVVTWDHAYGWDENPQTEISPVQHAYNIILDDGIEDFEFECQCNIEYGTYEEGEQIHAPIVRIKHKTLPYKRTQVPQDTAKMVAHIDVNKELLTYAVMTSPKVMRPHIIDYGTYPHQPGLFSKRKLTVPLSTIYPEVGDYRERIYLGIRDLVNNLVEREFLRVDGVRVSFDRIGIDLRYEDVYVSRAITESHHRAILRACWGVGVGPDDDLLHEKTKATILTSYENCFVEPNKSRTLDVLNLDTNFFKTEVHKGFNLDDGVRGSMTLFGKEADGKDCHDDRHLAFATHCNTESPKREEGKKKRRTRITWHEKMHQPDNEFFDNTTNCLALLVTEGVALTVSVSSPQKKKEREDDMQAFMNQQKSRRLM